jgi:hypothetical protein
LSVLDNKRQSHGPARLGHHREAVSQEENLRLHSRWRILNTNPHPCRVLVTIRINSDLDAVHRIQVVIDICRYLSVLDNSG